MGVYIKGMEMPQCCGDCHIGFCKQIGCELYIGFDNYATSRHPDCPISNITTPHGRLIDADELQRQFERMANEEWNKNIAVSAASCFDDAAVIVEDAPTIIEAEGNNGKADNC